MSDLINVDTLFGSIKPETKNMVEGNWMVTYSRAIHYNRDGSVKKITPWEPLGRIGPVKAVEALEP